MKHNRQGFIGWFVRNLVTGKNIEIFGDGKQLRDLNYVDDVVNALLSAGTNDKAFGEIFNLGMKDPISLEDLVKIMVSVFGEGSYSFKEFPQEKKKIDIGSIYADYSKAKSVLGWEPRVSIEEGIRNTLDYYTKFGSYYWE